MLLHSSGFVVACCSLFLLFLAEVTHFEHVTQKQLPWANPELFLFIDDFRRAQLLLGNVYDLILAAHCAQRPKPSQLLTEADYQRACCAGGIAVGDSCDLSAATRLW